MLIIGCDFHSGFQQVAIFDNRTGAVEEKRLQHREEAERFYGELSGPVRVGMVPKRWMVEPDGSTARFNGVTTLVWESKPFYKSEMALLTASTPQCRQNPLDSAHRR